MQNKLREKFKTAGVKMIDSQTVYFSEDTVIGEGVEIEPFLILKYGVIIVDNVIIKSFSHIENTTVRSGCFVGPFARLRGGADIGPNVQIGDFVEIKNSRIDNGAKVNHLAYVGDAEIGKNTNIGAGVITCNYDGFNKFKTKIGNDAFIGSNTALVAPVEVESGAIIGAASVITKKVLENSLVTTRTEQKALIDGASRFRRKRQKNQ